MTWIDPLRDAHRELRKAVPGKRRRAAREDAGLGAVYRAAMSIWDAQKAEGVSLAERVLGLSKTLRAAWPQTREWKYLCQQCSDYGLVMAECPGDATCGRPRAHLPHEYGTPCWCSLGQRFKEKAKSADDALTQAAKTGRPKSKGFTPAGRF